jgi:aminoglycoside phosphotransferase (APT) family kinase protein
VSSGINRIEIRRDTQGQKVLRRWAAPPIASALGIDPPTEVAAQRLAAAHGLAPQVFDYDAAAGKLSMAFVDGLALEADWMRYPARLALLHRIIKELRGLPAHELPAMDLPARLLALHDRLVALDETAARQWTPRVHRCVNLWRVLQAADLRRAADEAHCGKDARTRASESTRMSTQVLVHGDLSPANILLRADGTPCLLDWEYAHRGHPDEDLAGLVALLDADSPLVGELAEWSVAPQEFFQRVELRRLLDGLWHALARIIAPRDPAPSA